MDALMVTLKLNAVLDDPCPFLESYGRSLVTFPGYVDHICLQDRREVRVLHLFEDAAALGDYLDSRLLATLTAHPACFGRAALRRFKVLDGERASAEQVSRSMSLRP